MTAFPPSVEGLRAALALAPRLAVPYVVVIGQEMPIQFETHRDCITNNLFATIQMVEVVPAMRMSADLSHYVVEREMPCPPTPALQLLIEQVLQRADSFQGRVAASCQVQVPLHFKQHANWVALVVFGGTRDRAVPTPLAERMACLFSQ